MENIDLYKLYRVCWWSRIFVYGMNMLSEGLQKVAGTNLANNFYLTNNPIMGILVGALVTLLFRAAAQQL